MPNPNDALAAVKAFNAKYPNVGADLIQLLKDVAVPLKDTLNTAIQESAPNIPLVRGWVVREGITITDQTIDNFVDSLAAEIETNGT